MTQSGNFSEEILAVDAMSADIGLLEKLAARGGTLSEADIDLLARCHVRLEQLVELLAANNAAAGTRSSSDGKGPARLKKGRRSLMKYHVDSP